MRAIQLGKEGGCRLVEVAAPAAPGIHEIRIAMRLTPVNPADRLALEGRHLVDAYGLQIPFGAEGVGVVEAIGQSVSGLAIGDRVLPLDRGNWAEFRTILAERVIRAPEGLTDEEAAVFRINAPTAHRLLERADLREGDWLIHNGAGSMIGRLITAMGTARGLRVICVLRSPEKERGRLKELSAAEVIADDESMIARAHAVMGGARARLALDCVAGKASGRLAECLTADGRLTVFGHLSGEPCSIPSTLLTGGVTVDGFSLRADEGTAGRRELQSVYAPLAHYYTMRPTLLSPLIRFPVTKYEDAINHSGPERAVLDWSNTSTPVSLLPA